MCQSLDCFKGHSFLLCFCSWATGTVQYRWKPWYPYFISLKCGWVLGNRNVIYLTCVAASCRRNTRGLWINVSLVKFHLCELRGNLEGIVALRRPWQCGLSASSDENIRYLFPVTWQLTPQHLEVDTAPQPLPKAMLVSPLRQWITPSIQHGHEL